MIMPEVRTTMEPWKTLVVDDREAYALRQNGLLVEDDKNQAPAQDAEQHEEPAEDKGDGRKRAGAKHERS